MRLPGPIANKTDGIAVGQLDANLHDAFERPKAAGKLVIPPRRFGYVVHAISQHDADRIGALTQHRSDVIAVVENSLAIVAPTWSQLVVSDFRPIDADFVLPQS